MVLKLTVLLEKLNSFKGLEKLKLDKKKLFLIIFCGIVLIYIDFRFIISSQITALKRAQPKLLKLKNDLFTLNKDLAKMQDLENRHIEPDKSKLPKLKKIISLEEVSSLLQDISNMASNNEVKILEMKSTKEALASKPDKPVKDELKLTSLLINLELSCGYHQLGKFLNDLENGKIFITVQNMKIIPQTPDYLKEKVSLELKTYVRK